MAQQDEKPTAASQKKTKSQTSNEGQATKTETAQAKTAGESADTNAASSPKFQGKHKDRNVNPPEPSGKKISSLDEAAGSASAVGSQVQPQSGAANPSTQGEQTAGADTPAATTAQTTPNPAPDAAAGSSGDGTVTPPQQQVTGPGNSSDSGSGGPKKSKKPFLIGTVIVIVLLLLGLGAYAAYAQVYMPQQAPVSYFEQLSDFNSGEFEFHSAATEQMQAEDFNYDLNVSGEFVDNDDETAFSSESALEIGSGLMNMEVGLDLRYVDEVAYIRTDLADLLGMMGGGAAGGTAIDAQTWYSLETDEATQQELADDFGFDMAAINEECTDEDAEALEDYLENEAGDQLEITDPQRHDWFGVERGGQRVAHYSGTIEGASLRAIAEEMAARTSDECMAESDLTDEDLQELENVAFHYDLYRGDDQDELAVTVEYEEEDAFKFTLTTGNYNGDVDISAPEDSQSLEDVLSNLGGAFSGGAMAPGGTQPQQGQLQQPGDDFEDLEELEAEFDQSSYQTQ